MRAVIIYGPPGAGKGTQAELLSKRFGWVNFDTGHYLETLLYSPGWKKNPILKRERQLFDSGKLNTPSWVLKIVSEATKKIGKAGLDIIFSGSPRTLFEAFGDKRQKGLLALLNKIYGKKNIFIFYLDIKPQTSIRRNSSRLICSVCGMPIMGKADLKQCAFCGGKVKKRSLDDPEVIKVRLKQFKERTLPILSAARKAGYKVYQINGEPAPLTVHRSILKKLNLN